jgi:endo-1,4-beta-D-glucanase Y
MINSRRTFGSSAAPAVALMIAFLGAASCRPPSDPAAGGSGGKNGSGGQTASGGKSGSGGASSGGAIGSGGVASGGATGSGGAVSSGGASGSGGGAGSGGADSGVGVADASVADAADSAPPSRGPTPGTPGMSFPFPQNRESSRCVYPAGYRNEDVQAVYAQWKTDNVTTDGAKFGANQYRRVKRSHEPGLDANSTVSEGIGYGMLIAVYMNDQALFDDLWHYEQQFPDRFGLMNWYIKPDGSGPEMGGTGGATDADEDMAFALVMADKQWGGMGAQSKNYIDIAQDLISKIWANEIYQSKFIRPGPWGDTTTINLSYFAPAYYRLFAKVDTANASNWMGVIDSMYTVLNTALNSGNGNQNNGLVPAWCDTSGKPNPGAFGVTGGTAPTNYQYDSCRTPFRIGLDWCWTGETRAKDYVAKTSGFFSGLTVAKMVDGYGLDGTPQPGSPPSATWQPADNAVQSASFIGPAGVGAMSNSTYQSFVNDAYAAVATGRLLVGGTYYDESWTVMSMLMLTGNFLDYTAY